MERDLLIVTHSQRYASVMSFAITRRDLAIVLAIPVALSGQAALPQVDEVEASRAQIRENAERLAKAELAMTTEPAVHFRP